MVQGAASTNIPSPSDFHRAKVYLRPVREYMNWGEDSSSSSSCWVIITEQRNQRVGTKDSRGLHVQQLKVMCTTTSPSFCFFRSSAKIHWRMCAVGRIRDRGLRSLSCVPPSIQSQRGVKRRFRDQGWIDYYPLSHIWSGSGDEEWPIVLNWQFFPRTSTMLNRKWWFWIWHFFWYRIRWWGERWSPEIL